jgi:hypothetical protein
MKPQPPARHHEPLQVADDTFLIRMLNNEDAGSFAVYINSLVIRGPEPVIVDTGTVNNSSQWLDDVFGLVDPEDVRWVFLSHDDHDHVGNLAEVLSRCPNATLVTSWFAVERLSTDLALPLERMRWVNDGEGFTAGDRRLVAVRPPLFDSPTTRGLFDPRTGVYWAVDAFATPVQHAVDDVAELDPGFWREAFSISNRMNSPWTQWLDPAKWAGQVRRIEDLAPAVMASAHSPTIFANRVDAALQMMLQVAGQEEAPLPAQADLDAILAALDGLVPVAEAA